MDATAVRIADISETYGDAFAAHVRRGLRRTYGIREGVTVVFSTEPCRRTSLAMAPGARYKKSYYGGARGVGAGAGRGAARGPLLQS